MEEDLLTSLEDALGVRFHNRRLLVQALSHSSYIYEQGLPYTAGNERLEFLGDSVLGMVMAEYLYRHYPNYPEGKLSKVKSVVVSKKILARAGVRINLGDYILLGRGENLTGGRQRKSLLANVMESLIGAVYLDQGLETTREFIHRHLECEVEPAISGRSIRDHKSELQEIAQQVSGQVPRYRVTNTRGPDHDRVFEVEVYLDDMVAGLGSGKSKKSAEQKAAEAAIREYREKAPAETSGETAPPEDPGLNF
jgi:ribonuclease-3